MINFEQRNYNIIRNKIYSPLMTKFSNDGNFAKYFPND
jgi:hypothetical protein